jgi:hypothetical protein
VAKFYATTEQKLISFVKMTAFWAEMGVAYLEINKLTIAYMKLTYGTKV